MSGGQASLAGVRFSGSSGLVDRALELLAEGPRSTRELARRVLGVRAGPDAVARALVEELLRGEPRARADRRGTWRLTDRITEPEVALGRVRFTVVDVETTGGLAERGGRITELAAVRVEGGELVDVFSTLVDPGVPVSPWVSRLTGISNPMLRAAPPFREVCDEIRERLEGRVFVGHNASYDWRFLSQEMRRARAVMPRGPRLCTLQLTRRLLPGLERRGLDSLARYYGVEIEERHRARGDAIATARVFLRLLDESGRRGISTWRELRRALAGPAATRRAGVRSDPERGAAPC